jgi:hypothetical protein
MKMHLTTTQKIMLQRATPQDLYNIIEAAKFKLEIPEGWQVRTTCERDERTLTLEDIEQKWTIDPVEGKVWNKVGREYAMKSKGRGLLRFYADDGTQHMILRSHLVWLKSTGTWPTRGLCIDHIDQNPLNDKISNLREVSNSKNIENVTSKKLKVDSFGNLLPRGLQQNCNQYHFAFELADSFLTRITSNFGPTIFISTYSLEETYAYHVLKQLSDDANDFLNKLQLEPEDIQRIHELKVGINPKVSTTIHPLGVKQPYEQEFQNFHDDYGTLYGNQVLATIH